MNYNIVEKSPPIEVINIKEYWSILESIRN